MGLASLAAPAAPARQSLLCPGLSSVLGVANGQSDEGAPAQVSGLPELRWLSVRGRPLPCRAPAGLQGCVWGVGGGLKSAPLPTRGSVGPSFLCSNLNCNLPLKHMKRSASILRGASRQGTRRERPGAAVWMVFLYYGGAGGSLGPKHLFLWECLDCSRVECRGTGHVLGIGRPRVRRCCQVPPNAALPRPWPAGCGSHSSSVLTMETLLLSQQAVRSAGPVSAAGSTPRGD